MFQHQSDGHAASHRGRNRRVLVNVVHPGFGRNRNMVHEFDGTKHEKPRDMQATRRAKHPDPRQDAQRQREHQRLAAPALPQGNRPARIHRGTPRRSRHGTQQQAPQDPGPHKTQREDPRTDRRHRNINTNRHHQHQLPTKTLQRPLEFARSFPGFTHSENTSVNHPKTSEFQRNHCIRKVTLAACSFPSTTDRCIE